MDIRKAYNTWAEQYDTNENKTRDLEARSLREMLKELSFQDCLEIGCGTGKNTEWFIPRAEKVTAVDFSEEMLAKARAKIQSDSVKFIQADITKPWELQNESYDLVTFSLVLEHIENLEHVFRQVSKFLQKGGHVYIGELHPFKQYAGSKARFETEEGLQVVNCYTHHISDFVKAAHKYGMKLQDLREYFDEDATGRVPRILAMVFIHENP